MSLQLAAAAPAKLRDYWQLTKPRVVALIVFTAVAGMAVAAAMSGTSADPATLLAAVAGIGLAAAGAAAANCMSEHRIAARMQRTLRRATAAGRVHPLAAAAFSGALAGCGLALLYAGVNAITMWLTLATFVGYAVIYTMLLKPATPQNIVIGGAAGAMPPVLGWTAVTGQISHEPLVLFLIIFVWTPPHFWALALYRLDDYRKACVPMLPVTHGPAFTRLQILLYSIVLFAVSLLPFATGMAGWLYLAVSAVAGAEFVRQAAAVWRKGRDADARRLFAYSSIYLLAVFAALLADALLTRALAS